MAEAQNTNIVPPTPDVTPPGNPLAEISELLGGGIEDKDNQADAGGSGDQGKGDAGADARDQDEGKPGAGGSDEGNALETIEQLAEQAGLKPADLYKLAFPLKDGETSSPLTLGEAKDRLQEVGDVLAARQELEDNQAEFRKEAMTARQELATAVSLMGEVPPALLQQAAQMHQATLDRERQLLGEFMPEWRDDAKFQLAQDAIFDVVKEYGFTRQEMETVVDHRLTIMLNDFQRLVNRLKQAEKTAGEARTRDADNASRSTRTKSGADKREAVTADQINAAQGSVAAQVSLVSKLLSQG